MKIKNKKRTLQLVVVFLLFFAILVLLFTQSTQTLLDHAKPDRITERVVREDVERRVKEHFGEEDAILLDVHERYGDTYGIVGIAGQQYYARLDGDTILDSGRY